MPRFRFEARDRAGTLSQGELVAASMQEMLNILKAREQYPIEIRPCVVRTSAWTKLNLKLAASAREIADLCFHMSSMISAGLSLHETMGILAGRTRNATLSRTLLRITEDIEEGNSLAGAFRRYRYAFGDLLISVLKAGENSGKLDVILQEYSEQLEEQSKLTSDLRTALVYPCVLVLMTVASVTFLTGWILPRYVEQLEAMNVEIPKITRILLAVSSWVGDNWLLVGAGVVLGVGALVLAGRDRRVKLFFCDVVLRLPVAGHLVRRRATARFANTFSLLHSSGVPLLETLDLCGEAMGNLRLELEVSGVRDRVENGSSLYEAMAQTRQFPQDLARIVMVGEQTGRLPEMLSRIGRSYNSEVRRHYQRLVTLVEPVLIVFMGVVIGIVALSLILPMLRATKSFQG